MCTEHVSTIVIHLRGEFFFLQHKYAMMVMMKTTRLAAISPPITTPAIAAADTSPAGPGGPVVVVGVIV